MADIYKKASKHKLKVETTKGNLRVDQLWDLSLNELNDIAVKLEEQYEKSGKKSFLTVNNEKDTLTKLRFDIVLDILTTKVTSQNAAAKAAETKAHNQKILELIASKQDEELSGKSITELEAMLKQ